MATSKELAMLKRRLSPHLLAIEGVSGVGVRADVLTVYLVDDAESVLQSVQLVLESQAPRTKYRVIVSGRFDAMGAGGERARKAPEKQSE